MIQYMLLCSRILALCHSNVDLGVFVGAPRGDGRADSMLWWAWAVDLRSYFG